MNELKCCYDPKSCQSLLGYGRSVYVKSGGICFYCNLGSDSVDFDVWRQLSVDHTIPIRLFPGEGKTLQSVFPRLPNGEIKKLGKIVNDINLVTACNFCNSMTSRMKDINADGILSLQGYEDVTSISAEPIQIMLQMLQKRVDEELPKKKHFVNHRLNKLRETFETEVVPELQYSRKIMSK